MNDDEPVRVGAGGQLERIAAKLGHQPHAADLAPNRERAERIGRAHRAERFERACPARFAAARLDGLSAGPATDATVAWVADPTRNCLHVGPVGVGKTWAAMAQARELAVERRIGVWVVDVEELIDRLRPDMDSSAWERACSIEVLLLDDLGAERQTEWSDGRVSALIARRYAHELPILATTNLTLGPEDAPDPDGGIARRYGQRTYSRLVGDEATVIRWEGDDRRRQATNNRRPKK